MFVRRLEVKSPASHSHLHAFSQVSQAPATKLSAQEDQGFVDAGSLASFVSNISEQHREDVLNSTLLAQLAADHQFNRETQIEDWYGFYQNVLLQIGWDIQDFKFEEYKAPGETIQISKAIVNILSDAVTPSELSVVEKVMESLKSPANDPWWEVFSLKSSGPSSNGNLQVLLCKVDTSGQVLMVLCAFYFSASSAEDKWFWFNYPSSKIHMYKATQILTLDMSVYDQVRDEVIKKLGDNVKKFIGDLKI